MPKSKAIRGKKIPQAEIIDSLDDENLQLLKPMIATIHRVDEDAFVAKFEQAGISASGETPEESIAMLKDMISGIYRRLSSFPVEKLGTAPRNQLSVLRSYLTEQP